VVRKLLGAPLPAPTKGGPRSLTWMWIAEWSAAGVTPISGGGTRCLSTTHCFSRDPHDAVRSQVCAAGKVFHFFQAIQAPLCQERQETQPARLQHAVGV
jgi:hypothetical protein